MGLSACDSANFLNRLGGWGVGGVGGGGGGELGGSEKKRFVLDHRNVEVYSYHYLQPLSVE